MAFSVSLYGGGFENKALLAFVGRDVRDEHGYIIDGRERGDGK